MRHVPIAEFKDRLSEYVAAAEAGEEVVITRHGRTVARLVAPEEPQEDVVARRRAVLANMARLREELRARGFPAATPEEIREWINEGRP
ncbi:type II toxin-antitoxin system Phd/YefM family antitoxin [Sphingomonas lenta]|uniref:Antitoxin n=1 Tax=Sphingomonas lenta TaxID=1141887 RepID=A0A2A2SC92_9SPHN|nr:type II toxin-antitoxin system Phd/YefM family antitoxin [Sphingomonas lenta]PAX06869.1 prevent-host-death family protein [Sphingomonas lenta]